MNVTEKQKELIMRFMQQHPDFGRGRLRYNRENKRRLVSIMNIKYKNICSINAILIFMFICVICIV